MKLKKLMSKQTPEKKFSLLIYIKNLLEKNETLMKEWKSIEEIKKDIYIKIDKDILNIDNSFNDKYNECTTLEGKENKYYLEESNNIFYFVK